MRKKFGKKTGKKSGRGRSSFRYQKRSQEQWQKEKNRSTGDYDRAYKDEFNLFKAREGDNRIRILPPTFEDAEHFGIVVWLHSNVGPDNQTYLCHAKMEAYGGEGTCPICDEYGHAKAAGDEDYAKAIRPYSKVLTWIIDRNEADKGPQLWAIPGTVHKDILGNAEDPDTREILVLDHHEEGYDIAFKREGTGLKTKYNNVRPVPRASPLSDDARTMDKWLAFIQDNPLPTVLNFYDVAYIESAFSGKTAKREEEGGEEPEPETEETSDYDEPEDAIDDPDEPLDEPEPEESEEEEEQEPIEEFQNGDIVQVTLEDGNTYKGKITDADGEEAGEVTFDDGDVMEIPWDEIEFLERPKPPARKKKVGKKKISKVRQTVRERLSGK